MNKLLQTVFGMLSMCIAGLAQKPFNAFPLGNMENYHMRMEVWYPALQDAQKDENELNKLLTRFENMKGQTTNSSSNLVAAFNIYDSIQIKYIRLYNYYYLKSTINARDERSRSKRDSIWMRVDKQTAFFDHELSVVSQNKFNDFKSEQPELKKYEYAVQAAGRQAKHLIPQSLESYWPSLEPLLTGWQYDLYETVRGGLDFPTIKTKTGDLNVIKDKYLIETNPDSLVRKEGFRQLVDTYKPSRDLFAFALIHQAKALDQMAHMKNFEEAADLYYFDKFYSKEAIGKILKSIADSIKVYRDYQRMRRNEVAKLLPYTTPHYWDMKFSPHELDPRFNIEETTTLLINAMKPLGTEYQQEFQKLLDPQNGRLEIASAANKRRANFSSGFIGSKSIFYTTAYDGSYNDIRVMSHESTHAVHRELMNKNKVLPSYAVGPNYLFESFAIMGEFLLSDYLIKEAKTPEQKIFYLEKYFEGKGMAVFSICSDALLEQAIHEGVKKGYIHDAEDLDSLNNAINNIFSIWPTKQYPEQNYRWITNSLFYEDPFYNVNYVLGALLALQYYDLYTKNPKAFAIAYTQLLKNGFTANPEELLKQYLQIDINNSSMVHKALKIVKNKLAELNNLYKQRQ